ncbi:MAG: methyltransferase domain-containing protein [Patescibacteria group bacterium]
MLQQSYEKMWEDFGKGKASYLGYKFQPTYRIGLTNYLRECFIVKFLHPQKSDVVLDCGCAAGKQLFQLAGQIGTGHGIDIAQNFIDMADQYKNENGFHNLHFAKGDVENIPFAEATFDKIICAEVLEHVFDKDVALRELLRVLKPSGLLLITVPNLNADATVWGRFLRLLGVRKFKPINVFSKEELAQHGDAHVREFSRDSLRQWLEANSLKIIEFKSVSFIDGPRWFEFLLKILLHIKISQRAIINLEKFFSDRNCFWGRHLVVSATRK